MTRLFALLAVALLANCAGPTPPPAPTGPWQPINSSQTQHAATAAELEALPK